MTTALLVFLTIGSPGTYINAADDFEPFNQPPRLEPEIGESKLPKMPPGINELLAGYGLNDEEYENRTKRIRELTPEMIESLRAEYLARVDTKDRFKRNFALYVCGLILTKVNQFDEAKIDYDRDILIETVLEKLQSDDPGDIIENFNWLDRTRDWKIHDYIASFLDHEQERVRRAAARALPETKPLGVEVAQENSDTDNSTGDEADTSDNHFESTWRLWVGIALGIAILALLGMIIVRRWAKTST